MKKSLLLLFFLLGTVFGILFYHGKIPSKPSNPLFSVSFEKNNRTKTKISDEYTVTRVVDGDTIVVRINDGDESVRLIGLDTPEIVDPRKTVECFGKEASDEAKKILAGKTVRLETDASQDFRDKYGRLLAYVILTDGTNFNKFMIANGFGYEYTYKVPYKYQADFREAEKIARENKSGLWAEGICK